MNDDGYSTSEDLIKLVEHSLSYDLIWDVLKEKSLAVKSINGKIEHNLKNTNQLLGVIPNIVGGKTGYTDGALGTMMLVVDIPENNRIVSIILGSRDRFSNTKKLIDWIKKAYRWN